ncbi:PTS fructose transporter subunit IIABC [Actinomyces gaoshouyii]|uniref:PTS fructose transporter subunit IIABC n=1 Tax=Actinomyces gaoshouyii TaxID=1960083 RepID=UPI0009BD8E12|nr:fructose-specific PTS transporter subunit EIIC [Actinomyces gaoshouyii]ARD42347.1 PTS lactose transporter subunit IIC [Actinomyces gaoshouyii]
MTETIDTGGTAPLIVPELVALDASPGADKSDVITYLAGVVAGAGRADAPEGLASDALAREATAPTGIPGGIAIPHCRSEHVLAASLGFARLAEPVDFGAADGRAADLIFMIAAPAGADDMHLKLLAKLARGLMRTDFTDALRSAGSAEEVVRMVTEQVQPELLEGGASAEEASAPAHAAPAAPAGERIIVGATSCPTGIAHTFMAAEALEQAGTERGITVRIEGQGSGKIDALDSELIKRADAVVFAHDLPIKGRERFAGKPVIDVGVKAAVNDAGSLIDQALAAIDDPAAQRVPADAAGGQDAAEEDQGSVHWARRLQRAVMTGVSYMIPFVAAGGLLIALGFLLGGYGVALTPDGASESIAASVVKDYSLTNPPTAIVGEGIHSGMLLYLGSVLFMLGQAAMGFLVPALAGYIAFGLAGRPGIAPGFAMGVVATAVGSGFIGGLVGGILAGYVAAWLAGLAVPRWLRGLMPVVVIPLGTTLVVGGLMYLVLGRPLAALMTSLQDGLTSMSGGSSAILLGVILGLMMCFDLGGPVNKAAYLFATAGLSAQTTASFEIMAAVMAAGMVPPLAVSVATFLRPRLFTKAEVENGRSAWLLGLSFISEGAIPFAAADPLRIIPATMAGGAVTGALTMALHVGSRAPHGGLFVAFAITNVVGFLLAILAGVAVTSALVVALKGLGHRKAAAAAA